MSEQNGKICLGCTDRHVGCHGDCQRYLDWRNNLENYKRTVRHNQRGMIAHAQYLRERYGKER